MGGSRFVLFLVIAAMAGFAFLLVRWTNNELTDLRAGASSTASLEAESGVLSANAIPANDSNASDGKYVILEGSPTTPTPSVSQPPPTPGTWIEAGTHPHASKEYTTGYKTLWKLQPWYGVIYSGYGNSHQGPIAMDSFNPQTRTFSYDYLVSSELITHFRPLYDKLYVITENGMHTMEQSSFSVFDPVLGWYTAGNVNTSYARDMATLTGTDLWMFYNSHDNGDLSRGIEIGTNNWPILQRGTTIYVGADTGSVATFNNKVYLYNGAMTKIFDGTTWTDNSSIGQMDHATLFKNRLISYSGGRLGVFDGSTLTKGTDSIRDFVVYGNSVYILTSGATKTIKRSSDLATWTTITTAPTTAVSITLLKGLLYVGTTDSKIMEYTTNMSTLPEIWVKTNDDNASEAGSNPGSFIISRTGPTTNALPVTLALQGSATNGADYTSIPPQITIPAGSSSVSVPVTPIADGINNEGNEPVILHVTENSSYETGTPHDGMVIIHEKPAVFITEKDTEATEDGGSAIITIHRKGDLSSPLSVGLTFPTSVDLNGRGNWTLAKNGSDFSLPSTVTIPAGQEAIDIPISPLNDSEYEADEYIRLELAANSTYVRTLPSRALIHIKDNDPNPSPNLVQNPGFENATIAPWGSGTRDTTVAHSGTASLRIAGPVADLGTAYSPQTLNLTPGKKYIFSAWVKTNGEVTGRGATLRYAEITPTLKEYYTPWVRDSKGTWQYISGSFTISPAYTGGRIDLFYVINGPQTAWFDDISITEAP